MRFGLMASASLIALLSAAPTPTSGQATERMSDFYGFGAEGTIGRGTNILPWGPSDPRTRGHFSIFGPSGARYPSPPRYYTRGYSSTPMPDWVPAPPAPYLTNRCYEPGDGYRYPLYYDPSTRSFFYYPARRATRSVR
jgi:opacity protein-like surface antigen